MDEEIRECLKKDLLEGCPDCPTSDRDLIESLMDKCAVWEGDFDRHQWWMCVTRVVKVGDVYIGYVGAYHTGDESAEGKGWEFDPDSISQVYPRERQVLVTDYVGDPRLA